MTKVEVLQEVVHGHFEGSRCIAKDKWHNIEVEASKFCLESCNFDVVWMYTELVIALLDVKF